MLYLATRNGESLPQSLPTIRDNTDYPFKVQCKKVNTESIPLGAVICIIGYKLGKYLTSDGKEMVGDDSAWLVCC